MIECTIRTLDDPGILEAGRPARHVYCRKVAAMRVKSARRPLAIVIGLAFAAVTAAAPAASAMAISPPGGGAPGPHSLVRTVVVTAGLSGWQVAVVAVCAAILGAAATIVTRWGWTRRRPALLRTS